MIQTIYCYYYTAHSATWEPDAAVYPFEDTPQDILATIRPLEPVSWGAVPLALRITFPDGTCHALRLTVRRRRLPRDEGQVLAPDGSPVYPRVTGSQSHHCFWCYTSAHTCRPVAWLLPVKAGLCLRFRRNTQRVLRLTLPATGTAPLEQAGYTVELLPKLAFFTLWDRPPSSGLIRPPARNDAEGGLPSGGPSLPEPADPPEEMGDFLRRPAEAPELMGGGAGPAAPSPGRRGRPGFH